MPIITWYEEGSCWLEHLTVNQRVLGSSPRGGATYNDKTVILL